MRLLEPWFFTLRIVVADSWFGGVRTAEELKERLLFCVMSVKTAHKGYPKAQMKELLKKRGDVCRDKWRKMSDSLINYAVSISDRRSVQSVDPLAQHMSLVRIDGKAQARCSACLMKEPDGRAGRTSYRCTCGVPLFSPAKDGSPKCFAAHMCAVLKRPVPKV